MILRRICGMLAAGLMAAMMAGPGLAEAVTYVTQGRALFNFEAPDGWEVLMGREVAVQDMPDGETPMPRIISVLPRDESADMWTGLWSPSDVSDFPSAKKYLQRLGPRLVAEPEVSYSDSRTVGGRPARVFSGTGFRDGKDIDFAFAVIQIAKDRIAVAAFIGEPASYDKYEKPLIALLKSVKPGGAR